MVTIILWTSIKEVHAKGPQLNTLYVDIGQLYPQADFAGVIIDLNVNQAIARGINALNLTDNFLQHSYNKAKQNKNKNGPMDRSQQEHPFLCPETPSGPTQPQYLNY